MIPKEMLLQGRDRDARISTVLLSSPASCPPCCAMVHCACTMVCCTVHYSCIAAHKKPHSAHWHHGGNIAYDVVPQKMSLNAKPWDLHVLRYNGFLNLKKPAYGAKALKEIHSFVTHGAS